MTTPGLSTGARLVLGLLADMAGESSRLAWPSRERLSRETGLSDRQIARHLAALCALGYITETEAAHRGRVRTFRLHPDRWPRCPKADTNDSQPSP